MKVSKVMHTRMSVGEKKQDIKGMLYYNPNADKKEIDLVAHIEELNKKAKSLYKVFIVDGKKDKERIVSMAENVNEILLSQYIEKSEGTSYSLDSCNKCKIEIYEREGKRKIYGQNRKPLKKVVEVSDDQLSELSDILCNLHLRKSLKKEIKVGQERVYAPVILNQVVLALHKGTPLSDIGVDKVTALLNLIKEDYQKQNQINQIANSIEKQQVKVQVVNNDGDLKLQLSNAVKPKKAELFKTLIRLADSDEEEVERILVRFKKLLLCFLGVIDEFDPDEEDGILAWTYGTSIPEANSYFSDEVYGYCSDLLSVQGEERALQNEKKKLLENGKARDKRVVDIKNEVNKLKIEKKKLKHLINDRIGKTIAERYRACCGFENLNDNDKYWLLYIEDAVYSRLNTSGTLDVRKLKNEYLCKDIYKEFTSFLAGKFVDMGKAVYHFAMPKVESLNGQLSFGKIQPEYQNGLTSFDYERVKAEETRERQTALAVSFAANNYRNLVEWTSFQNGKNEETDPLTVVNESTFNNGANVENERRKLLQYFGGQQRFDDEILNQLGENGGFYVIARYLAQVRNKNFHYTVSTIDEVGDKNKIAKTLLAYDAAGVGELYRAKYYSNNTPMFYSESDLCALIGKLYSSEAVRPSQTPAFNRILNKPNLRTFLNKMIPENILGSITGNAEKSIQFSGAIFFILKEIYYNGYLKLPDLTDRFINTINELQNTVPRDQKEAVKAFSERLTEITKENKLSFGEICQSFMTEFNLQNQIKEAKDTGKGEKKEHYQNFRMVLYDGIKESFKNYVMNEPAYAFLKKPLVDGKEMADIPFEAFLPNLKVSEYMDLVSLVEKDASLAAWYILGHFINPKQLNHLIGALKEYISYSESINARAKIVGNRTSKAFEEQKAYYEKVLRVLGLCMVYAGQVSNNFLDYFNNTDEYDAFIKKFVNTKVDKTNYSLYDFCNTLDLKPLDLSNPFARFQNSVSGTSVNKPIGLYYDGKNPKIIRGVILAKLYGNVDKISQNYKKVSKKEIEAYYTKQEQLEKVFKKGECGNKKEQEELREYQFVKNCVELSDVQTFSELTNDMMTRLIEWCYMRERDLMYFQLGVQYIRINYGTDVPKKFVSAKAADGSYEITSGAILYSIVAMYTHSLPAFKNVSDDGIVDALYPRGASGEKLGYFCCCYSANEYKRCLSLFEYIGRKDANHQKDDWKHDEIIKVRNFIDHFKFYSSNDYSILDLYAYVFDNFFTYDRKLKKSVSFIIKNILVGYFIKTDLIFDKQDNGATRIVLSNHESEKLTFKIKTFSDEKGKEKNVVEAPAVSDSFISQAEKLLSNK